MIEITPSFTQTPTPTPTLLFNSEANPNMFWPAPTRTPTKTKTPTPTRTSTRFADPGAKPAYIFYAPNHFGAAKGTPYIGDGVNWTPTEFWFRTNTDGTYWRFDQFLFNRIKNNRDRIILLDKDPVAGMKTRTSYKLTFPGGPELQYASRPTETRAYIAVQTSLGTLPFVKRTSLPWPKSLNTPMESKLKTTNPVSDCYFRSQDGRLGPAYRIYFIDQKPVGTQMTIQFSPTYPW